MDQHAVRLSQSVDQAIQAARQRLERLYGERLRHVLLYGSHARGDAREESDVDLMVVLDGPIRRYQEITMLADLSMDLFDRFGEWISCMVMSVSDFEDPGHPLMMNVRREGVEV